MPIVEKRPQEEGKCPMANAIIGEKMLIDHNRFDTNL